MIRRLAADDIPAYIALRREALITEPHAFAASPSDDSALDPEHLKKAMGDPDRAIFGAFAPELAGIVGIGRMRGEKSRHKAFLWGLYVGAAYRGRSLGHALTDAAIGFARSLPHVTQVNLVTSIRTPRAEQLYEALGFVVWGVEPAALRIAGELVDDRHMILRFGASGTP